MDQDQPKVKSPLGMLVMSGIVIALVAYLYWDTVRQYQAGGPGAPTFSTLVVGGGLLLAGALYVGTSAIRIFLQEKNRKESEDKEEA